jgi:hypothetical protein
MSETCDFYLVISEVHRQRTNSLRTQNGDGPKSRAPRTVTCFRPPAGKQVEGVSHVLPRYGWKKRGFLETAQALDAESSIYSSQGSHTLVSSGRMNRGSLIEYGDS